MRTHIEHAFHWPEVRKRGNDPLPIGSTFRGGFEIAQLTKFLITAMGRPIPKYSFGPARTNSLMQVIPSDFSMDHLVVGKRV